MSKPLAVKEEVQENETLPTSIVNDDAVPPITQSMPPLTTSSSAVFDDPTLLSALLENSVDYDDDGMNGEIGDDEEDEIVREIDVYISPELANTMHLIQFPLFPATHSHQPLPAPLSSKSSKKQPKSLRAKPPPHPIAARIKPENSILELNFRVPSQSFSDQRQVPAVLSLPERRFTSHDVPLVTHMAMGLFDSTNSKIDLIPLHGVKQMRPSFDHVDALFISQDDEALEEEKKKEEKKKKSLQPIVFKKSETERAAMQRMSSYAYKKANEDAEEWIDLNVQGYKSTSRKEAIKRAYCPRELRENNLEFVRAGKIGGNAGYVRSLNYLPSTVIEESAEEFTIDENNEMIAENNEEPEWKRELTMMVGTLLQERGGMPIPYPVLRSRFKHTIPDEELINAISASAVLVRGNFILKSTLMALSNVFIEKARDVILVLMTKHGFIQRARLYQAFQKADDDMSAMVTLDVINSLLELMGRKIENGIEMKIDDDLTFESQFSDVANMHAMYWDEKETELQKYINLYENEDDMADAEKLNQVLFGDT